MKIEGRTFVVSGGASGLGRATVEMLVAGGGNVVILDMNEDLGNDLVTELGASRTKFMTTDVASSESIAEAVTKTLDWVASTGLELGGILPMAGVASPAKILTSDGEPFDMDGFDFVMNINVRGSIDLIRQFLPYLSKVSPLAPDQERGVIIMVSSSAAFDGQPGQVSYAASKGAIASVTLPCLAHLHCRGNLKLLSRKFSDLHSVTRDLARYGIRVVTLAPSLFDSGMTALMSDKVSLNPHFTPIIADKVKGTNHHVSQRKSLLSVMEFPLRPGLPAEFASLVKQSVENTMLNGTVLRIDGGMRMPSKM